MRGSPLIRALIVFAALLTLAPLLWHMTQPDAEARQAPPAPVVPDVGTKTVKLELTFTTPAQRIEVVHLSRVVWAKDLPAEDEEAELTIPWPKEGVDLQFKVQWPGNARAALRVKVSGADVARQEQTVWTAEKVLTFQ